MALRVLSGQLRQLPSCPGAVPGTKITSQGEPCGGVAQRREVVKRKAVPSDPPHSLLPSRHARPERGFGSPVRFSRRSPPWLLAATDQRSGRRTALRSRRSRRLGAAFHSPTAFAPFRSLLCGVSVPGLPLRRLTACCPDPFGLRLPSSRRFCGAGRINARSPLPGPAGRNPVASSGLAPRRDLSIPQVHRSARFSLGKLTRAASAPLVAPRIRLPCGRRLRLIAPRFARRLELAVPRTSRNHSYRATRRPPLSSPPRRKSPNFSKLYHLFFQMVTRAYLLKFSE